VDEKSITQQRHFSLQQIDDLRYTDPAAMYVNSIDLRTMLDFRPNEGRILMGADRMLLLRQSAFGVLRSLLFERLGTEMTHSLLAQFGYRCGGDDFRALMSMFEWDTDIDRVASGPVMHSWEGIVLAKPDHLEYDRAAGTFYMYGSWTHSYEAEIHRDQVGQSTEPVCYTLAGYASGYGTAFMGKPLLCVETQCMAMGADTCRWEVRPTDEWDDRALPYKRALDSTSHTIQKELERSLAHLSTPILRIWDGVLAVPLIGTLDVRRTDAMMDTVLGEIARASINFVILDVTGIDSVDDATADGILRLVAAVKLLGAECHLSGIRGDVARTLATTSLDLTKLRTFATLKQALQSILPKYTGR
jgi:anti-anti-sigma factor